MTARSLKRLERAARRWKEAKDLASRKAKEKIVPEKLLGRHRVFYRPSQVESSFPCHIGLKIKLGQRLAMLFPHNEFLAKNGKVPKAKFYTGTVTELTGEGQTRAMTIEFDGHPYCSSINCGVKHYELFCIPIKE